MAYTPTPVDRAGDALRHITSIAVAAQLISSGASLPTERETNNLIIDLLFAAELIGKLGLAAMEEVEASVSRNISSTMTA